jgi:hypothetical protein
MSEKPRKTPTISSTTHSLPKNLREGFIPDTSEDKESFVLENVRKYNDCVFQAFEVSQGSLTIQGIFLEKIALMEENPKEFLKQYLQHVPPADPETMYEINNVIHFDTEVTEPLKLELMNRLLARYTGKHPKSSGSSTGTEAIALRVRTSMEEVLRKNSTSISS